MSTLYGRGEGAHHVRPGEEVGPARVCARGEGEEELVAHLRRASRRLGAGGWGSSDPFAGCE